MSEFIRIALTILAGIFLGGVFFGGLWLTVKKGISSQRQVLWFTGSLLLRMGITLTGFYLVGQNDLKQFCLCLLGFIIARYIVKWLVQSFHSPQSHLLKEAHHASQS